MRTGHICGVVCCVLQLVFGFSPRHGMDRCEVVLRLYLSLLLYQIALTWGVEHQTRFNYLPAQPQTLRSPHPPDNFCQILLARQETHDGEGQWSRRGRRSLRRSKSSGDVASGSLLQPSENWMLVVGGTNVKSSG